VAEAILPYGAMIFAWIITREQSEAMTIKMPS
jgi:hypothetical protein